MAKFPRAYVGLPITADFWNQGRPDWYYKSSATTIASDASLNDDPDLSGITLDVGVYYIRSRLFAQLSATATTVDISVAWNHSGTASGSRMCLGPDTGIGVNGYWDGAAHQVTTAVRALPRLASTGAYNTSISYGLRDTFGHEILEDGIVTVTASGVFAVQWAQSASSATQLTVNAGSYLRIEQIG